MSLDISMKELLETGVHFGHRTNRWDPRMKSYIFTERNGIHIVDLQQTVERLKEAYNLIRDSIAEGGNILLVGTKRQAQETILTEAERCGMPYVVERWLPGTLTNWSTIHARIMELERLEKMRDSGEMERLIKKEQLTIERKINRLLVHLSGIRHMNGLPDLLFVVDVTREYTAVHEANLKGVPVIAMVDTNCDPTNIDYLIPSNDDAIRAIKLIVHKVADAVLEGKAMRKEDEEALKPIGEDEIRVRAAISLEEEVDDKDLLGDTLLKKLEKSRQEQLEAEAKEAEAKEAEAKEAEAKKAEVEEKTEEEAEPEEVEEKAAESEETKDEETKDEVAKPEEVKEEPKPKAPDKKKEPEKKPEKVEDKKVEELDLGARTNNLLIKAKIKKVSQLVKKLEKDVNALQNIPGIGPKTADNILNKLKKMGYKFDK